MVEYGLSRQQRESIPVDHLAMLILRVLQRNHRETENGNTCVGYHPYDMTSIRELEIVGGETSLSRGDLSSFELKFAEAVNLLKLRGLIMLDPTQDSNDCQRPTSAGLRVDTTAPVLGITTSDEFVRRVEHTAGRLDDVARAHLAESFAAAESGLWMSSVFMLGAAAERLIYVLAEHADHLLADPTASGALSKIHTVRQRKEWIVAQLPALRKKLPAHRDAFTDVEDKFDSLYNAYRYQRNEAGHPAEVVFEPNITQCKAVLFSFSVYAQAVNAILAIP
jgi:hypothetical protein